MVQEWEPGWVELDGENVCEFCLEEGDEVVPAVVDEHYCFDCMEESFTDPEGSPSAMRRIARRMYRDRMEANDG